MADLSELLALQLEVGRYIYRPGWRLSVEPGRYGFLDSCYELVVHARVEDSRDPSRRIEVQSRHTIPPHLPEMSGGFARWLAHTLECVEIHESREWLRCDGELVNDPHAPVRPVGARG